MTTGKERLTKEFTDFPLIVKPVAEGSSQGRGAARASCHNEAELREVVQEMVGKYQQPALVEEYIGGREFTVGLLGERRPKVLPPMEIVFLDKEDKTPVYSFQHKLDWNDRIRYDVPAKLEPGAAREAAARRRAARSWRWAAATWRASTSAWTTRGRFYFIECNPLPGPHAGLERPGADRPGRGHGLPHAHRGDPGGRHPPLQGARAAPRAADAPAQVANGNGNGGGLHAPELGGSELREGKG